MELDSRSDPRELIGIQTSGQKPGTRLAPELGKVLAQLIPLSRNSFQLRLERISCRIACACGSLQLLFAILQAAMQQRPGKGEALSRRAVAGAKIHSCRASFGQGPRV
jgi:hypothetical protein